MITELLFLNHGRSLDRSKVLNKHGKGVLATTELPPYLNHKNQRQEDRAVGPHRTREERTFKARKKICRGMVTKS